MSKTYYKTFKKGKSYSNKRSGNRKRATLNHEPRQKKIQLNSIDQEYLDLINEPVLEDNPYDIAEEKDLFVAVEVDDKLATNEIDNITDDALEDIENLDKITEGTNESEAIDAEEQASNPIDEIGESEAEETSGIVESATDTIDEAVVSESSEIVEPEFKEINSESREIQPVDEEAFEAASVDNNEVELVETNEVVEMECLSLSNDNTAVEPNGAHDIENVNESMANEPTNEVEESTDTNAHIPEAASEVNVQNPQYVGVANISATANTHKLDGVTLKIDKLLAMSKLYSEKIVADVLGNNANNGNIFVFPIFKVTYVTSTQKEDGSIASTLECSQENVSNSDDFDNLIIEEREGRTTFASDKGDIYGEVSSIMVEVGSVETKVYSTVNEEDEELDRQLDAVIEVVNEKIESEKLAQVNDVEVETENVVAGDDDGESDESSTEESTDKAVSESLVNIEGNEGSFDEINEENSLTNVNEESEESEESSVDEINEENSLTEVVEEHSEAIENSDQMEEPQECSSDTIEEYTQVDINEDYHYGLIDNVANPIEDVQSASIEEVGTDSSLDIDLEEQHQEDNKAVCQVDSEDIEVVPETIQEECDSKSNSVDSDETVDFENLPKSSSEPGISFSTQDLCLCGTIDDEAEREELSEDNIEINYSEEDETFENVVLDNKSENQIHKELEEQSSNEEVSEPLMICDEPETIEMSVSDEEAEPTTDELVAPDMEHVHTSNDEEQVQSANDEEKFFLADLEEPTSEEIDTISEDEQIPSIAEENPATGSDEQSLPIFDLDELASEEIASTTDEEQIVSTAILESNQEWESLDSTDESLTSNDELQQSISGENTSSEIELQEEPSIFDPEELPSTYNSEEEPTISDVEDLSSTSITNTEDKSSFTNVQELPSTSKVEEEPSISDIEDLYSTLIAEAELSSLDPEPVTLNFEVEPEPSIETVVQELSTSKEPTAPTQENTNVVASQESVQLSNQLSEEDIRIFYQMKEHYQSTLQALERRGGCSACMLFDKFYDQCPECIDSDSRQPRQNSLADVLGLGRDKWTKKSAPVNPDDDEDFSDYSSDDDEVSLSSNQPSATGSGSGPFVHFYEHKVFGEIEVYESSKGNLYYKPDTALKAIGVSQDVLRNLPVQKECPSLQVTLNDEDGNAYEQIVQFWPTSLILKTALEDCKRQRTDMTSFMLKVMLPLMMEILGIRKDYSDPYSLNRSFNRKMEKFLWDIYVHLPSMIFQLEGKVNDFYWSE